MSNVTQPVGRARPLTCILLLSGLLAVYAMAAFAVPPRLFWDASKGFEVRASMKRGAPFNHLAVPDSADLSRDSNTFIAWWSPGQYAVPGVLNDAGLPIAWALTLTTLFCHAIGLYGWYRVYRVLEFDADTAWWACFIVATQACFAHAFAVYLGGETLIFAFLPWPILACLRWRERPYRIAGLLFAAIVIGAFLKLSFLLFGIVLLAACGLRVLRERSAPWHVRGPRLGALLAGAAMGAAAVWLGFSRHGATPNMPAPRDASWLDVAAPFANVLISALEGNLPNEWPYYPTSLRLACVPTAAVAGACLLIRILKQRRGSEYGNWLACAALVYIPAFVFLYLSKSQVDYTARHLRPLGLILLPGLVLEFRTLASRWIRFAGLALLISAHAGFAFVNAGLFLENAAAPRSSPAGYALPEMPAAVLDALQRLDGACAESNALFALPRSDLRGALPHVRFVHFPLEAESMEQIRGTEFRGKADHLIFAMPLHPDGRDRAVATAQAFTGYRLWRFFELDGWIISVPKDDTTLLAVMEQTLADQSQR